MADQEKADVRHDYVAPHVNGKRDYRAEQAKFESEIDALPDYALRAPCRCGSSRGKGPRDVSGQAMIYCADCRLHAYNAPKHETGRGVRKVLNREGLRPGQRERILQRDGAECAICETKDPGVGGWHIDHCVSVMDCKSFGFDADDYNYDGNLCVLCEACNLGKGSESLMDTKLIKLFLRHNRHRRGRPQP
jgi:5-methylcytosine-specific restriction endonuclease McrA